MEYVRGRQDGQASAEGAAGNFSGRALMDAVLADGDGKTATVRVNNVFFAPGGRTYWHSHANGQVLLVSTGHGLVANREGQRHDLRAGDAVWAPPGEEHWHGAAPDALLSHTAISLGLTSWLEEVSADDYQAAFHHGA
jgi:quercetin dioxygenase-like cupin family protein